MFLLVVRRVTFVVHLEFLIGLVTIIIFVDDYNPIYIPIWSL